MKTMQVSPKTILITGASSGIGAALAQYYAAENTILLLIGQNEKRLQQIVDVCQKKGAKIDSACCDVSDRSQLAQLMARWIDQYDIDLAIANAGISAGTAGIENSFENDHRIMAVNFSGILHLLEPLIPVMKARQSGQIALVSSLASYVGLAGAAAYSASKAAVRVYGEALRVELSDYHIQVSVICPGFVTSRITDQNDFTMPYLMPAEQAAFHIAKGLQRNKPRITFPWQMRGMTWILRSLPSPLLMALLEKLPRKG